MLNFLQIRLHPLHTHILQNNSQGQQIPGKKYKKKLLEPQQKTKS